MAMDIKRIKLNPNNPRLIKDNKFEQLVTSLKDFPEMANVRPIVVNKDMVILGGNMRFRAMKQAGWKDIPVEVVDWSEDKQREFIVKDNVGFGEWDWSMIANEWDTDELEKWGLDIPDNGLDEEYTTKIETPIYEPKQDKPNEDELVNLGKYNELMDKIAKTQIEDKAKLMLQLAATRHIQFDYGKLAEYYAHSDEKVQELMEESALVIIDYNKAIELGFVKLFDTLETLSENEA